MSTESCFTKELYNSHRFLQWPKRQGSIPLPFTWIIEIYSDARLGRILHRLPAVICGTIVNICSRYLIVPVYLVFQLRNGAEISCDFIEFPVSFEMDMNPRESGKWKAWVPIRVKQCHGLGDLFLKSLTVVHCILTRTLSWKTCNNWFEAVSTADFNNMFSSWNYSFTRHVQSVFSVDFGGETHRNLFLFRALW